MILADSHIHSKFSLDSSASLESMADAAIEQGLKYLTFTDHCDLDYPNPTDPNLFLLQKPPYFAALEALQEVYKGKLEVLIGVEIGLGSDQAEAITAFADGEPFDFVIGSSHVVHGKDPYLPGYFDGITESEGYLRYFQTIPENALAIKCYNVYGHMDYVVRYGPNKDLDYNPSDYQDIFDTGLKTIISDGKGIELNTGGWTRGLRQAHPHIDILKRYSELGGEIITVGSDSHSPGSVGYGFAQAEELLKEVGFKYYAVYKAQVPHFFPL
ncbi:MAG TPA: histidinol-phosphatase HisJ family protein [Anaerolineaceae bacterium]|nr:histidinol-phosphatase HisJ family protein [Anaerolineaceae bacterium]